LKVKSSHFHLFIVFYKASAPSHRTNLSMKSMLGNKSKWNPPCSNSKAFCLRK